MPRMTPVTPTPSPATEPHRDLLGSLHALSVFVLSHVAQNRDALLRDMP